MSFVKTLKTRAYYKRFQVKFRRRREGRTDFYARQRLINQDKNKYGSPKFRFVVRFTNKDVICQVVYATMDHDVCMAAAYASELPRFGVKGGLTNYAATYCTGLLCARRLLKKFDVDTAFEGQKNVKDADYTFDFVPSETVEGRRPFKAFLDVGLKRTSSGSRLFAAVKGACDGGLNVPHSTRRFFGFDEESKELDGEAFRNHLLGGHVADYMRLLEEEDAERYQKQFSAFIKAGLKADDLEKMYLDAHAAIRADPARPKKEAKKPAKPYVVKREKKISREQRRQNAQVRIQAALEADEE